MGFTFTAFLLLAVAFCGTNITFVLVDDFISYNPSATSLGWSWYLVLTAALICIMTAELIAMLRTLDDPN